MTPTAFFTTSAKATGLTTPTSEATLFKLTIRALHLAAAFCQETLADLVLTGQREAVLAAITSPDLDVNVTDPDGSTALLWATYRVDHELVSALLKDHANPNITNHFGSAPLTEATKLGDVDLVRMLLDAKADPDSPNQDNQTAL